MIDQVNCLGGAKSEDKELEIVTRKLQDLYSHADGILVALSNLQDRLIGPEPECESTSVAAPYQPGVIGEIKGQLDSLKLTLNRIDEHAQNLSRIA